MHRVWLLLVGAALVGGCDDTEFNSSGGASSYEADFVGAIALFHDHCQECHPSLIPSFDANLLQDDIVNGEGRFVVAGDRDASALYLRLVGGQEGYPVMPPTGALSADAVEAMGQWIDDGAPLLEGVE